MATEGHITGRIADGRYRLDAPLGRGGMGQVWRAHDELLHREVAVKEVVFPEVQSEEERAVLETRVLREARASARLTHPGVVTVFDVVREEGRAFIVMELVAGTTLSQLVKRNGPLEPREAARIGAEVLDILRVAHEGGIVHRDVKASNVLLTDLGSVKLADFGIASLRDETSLTMTGQVFGSPHYMSPEQAAGERAGPATDLWGLGATLFFAVEGRPPFEGDHPLAVLGSVVHGEPAEPHRAGPLGDVIRALLQKDPSARPGVDEAMAMLRAVAAGGPVHTTATPVGHEESTPEYEPVPAEDRGDRPQLEQGAPKAHPRTQAPRERSGLRPVLIGLVALLVLAGAAVVTLVLLTRPETPGAEDRAAGGRQSGQAGATPDAAIPASWDTYEDPDTGWTLAHPPDWELVTQDETRLDFRDPETGTYIRVDWTDQPGPSPVGAWRDLERSFSASHEGYRRVDLFSTTYKGHEAAVWEFTFVEGGAKLHAVDLGFVTGEYGFALYFQTRQENWETSQQLFEKLKAGFRPPA
jgi:eukaryotic-like serine/threonine-protein kinase